MNASGDSQFLMVWRIRLDAGSAFAFGGDKWLEARRPVDLWRAIAKASYGRPVYLLPEGMAELPQATAAAFRELVGSGASALFGRIAYADDSLSQAWQDTEAMRFLDIPAGSFIATADALTRAASRARDHWDAYWPYDLGNALRHLGAVTLSDTLLAHSDQPPPATMRMPFRRAGGRPADGAAPLILVYGKVEASVSLHFDGLPDDLAARLRFLRPGDLFSDMTWLAAASLVLVVRDFEHMLQTGTLALLQEIGVPYAWFADDDLEALSKETGAFDFYSEAAIRQFAEGAAAIVTTSPALVAGLGRFHDRVILWPCVYDAALAFRPAFPPVLRTRSLTIGAFGGGFRHRSFAEDVLPALRDLRVPPERIYAHEDLARRAAEVEALPFERDFREFVFRWQRLAIDVLVHPYGQSATIGNKSPASILAALYLGAVLVVGDEPAYADYGEADGVLKAAPGPDAWRERLERLSEPSAAEAVRRRFELAGRARFAPESARAPFAELSALALPGDADAQARRWQQAAQSEALQKALPLRSASRSRAEKLMRSLSRRLIRLRRQ